MATDTKDTATKAKPKKKKAPLLNKQDDAWIRHQEAQFEKVATTGLERKLYTPDIWKTRVRVLARSEFGTDDISGVVDSLTWQDESTDDLSNINTQAAMVGTLTFRKPNLRDYAKIAPLVFPKKESYNARVGSGGVGPGVAAQGALGGMIICQVGYGKTWHNIWAMRVVPGPDQGIGDSITLSDGTRTLNLADDLWILSQGDADFKYVKGKKTRKEGWRCDEIAADVCKRYRVPVRTLAKGTSYFALSPSSTQLKSPLAVITQAYKQETNRTGRTFIIRWGAPDKKHPLGGLEVIPMRRNRLLYKFREQLIDATLSRNMAPDFCNVIEARGTIRSTDTDDDSSSDDSSSDSSDSTSSDSSSSSSTKTKTKKAKSKKITHTVINRSSTQRFGWVRKTVNFGAVSSPQELEILAKRSLAIRLTPIRTAELTHPGIATIRRGDAVRINIPEEGYARKRLVAYETPNKPKNKIDAKALAAAEKDDPSMFSLGTTPVPVQRGGQDVSTDDTGSKNVPQFLPVSDQGIAYVTSAVHTVAAGSYTMDLTMGFINVLDPKEMREQVDAAVRKYKVSAKKAAQKAAAAAKKKADDDKKKADDSSNGSS